MRLDNEELAIKEALMFGNNGGSTIVDLTNVGLARNPFALARISRATGLNIVMGSGYYVLNVRQGWVEDINSALSVAKRSNY